MRSSFTKSENLVLNVMFIGGLLISLTSIASMVLNEIDSNANFIFIIVNIFYWALVIIMINSILHNVLMRKIEEQQSYPSVEDEKK